MRTDIAIQCLSLATAAGDDPNTTVDRARKYLAFVEDVGRKPSIFALIRIGREAARERRFWGR